MTGKVMKEAESITHCGMGTAQKLAHYTMSQAVLTLDTPRMWAMKLLAAAMMFIFK